MNPLHPKPEQERLGPANKMNYPLVIKRSYGKFPINGGVKWGMFKCRVSFLLEGKQRLLLQPPSFTTA
jgi:hypothetical protein